MTCVCGHKEEEHIGRGQILQGPYTPCTLCRCLKFLDVLHSTTKEELKTDKRYRAGYQDPEDTTSREHNRQRVHDYPDTVRAERERWWAKRR